MQGIKRENDRAIKIDGEEEKTNEKGWKQFEGEK